MSVCGHTLMMVPTRDVRNELLIVLYLNIHVGHDKTNIYLQLLSKIFINSDFCNDYLHTLDLFKSL